MKTASQKNRRPSGGFCSIQCSISLKTQNISFLAYNHTPRAGLCFLVWHDILNIYSTFWAILKFTVTVELLYCKSGGNKGELNDNGCYKFHNNHIFILVIVIRLGQMNDSTHRMSPTEFVFSLRDWHFHS